MASATHTAPDNAEPRRFSRGDWLILALALGYIAGATVYVLLAYQQPTDGWRYGAGLGGNNILVANQSGAPSPLRAGDALLAIDGRAVVALDYRPVAAPPTWRVAGAATYMVERDGQRIDLQVPLVTRPPSVLLAYLWGGNDGSPWHLIQAVSWYLIGFAVFLLRPRSTAARLLLLIVAIWATYDAILAADTPATIALYPAPLFWFRFGTELLWTPLFAMNVHLVLAFPVRSAPLARWPAATLGALYGLPTLIMVVGVALANDEVTLSSLFLVMAVLVVALVATTIVNLRTAREAVVRAQIGWMLLGIALPSATAIILQLALFLNLLRPEQVPGWLNSASSLTLPLCLGIAITRYHLFDITVVIRRTLVYSALTISLGAVYLLAVTLLQALFVRLTGQESTLAVVASTLAIAALFQPLRARVQALIDRRFFRKKYDARRVLTDFGRRAQQQAELDMLAADVLGVVQETLEPEHTTLWIARRS